MKKLQKHESFLNNQDRRRFEDFCLFLLHSKCYAYDLDFIKENENQLNRYPNLEKLEPPRDIFIFNEKNVHPDKIHAAIHTILDGKLFCEHACAGEATRLSLGTKYLIKPQRFTVKEIMNLMNKSSTQVFSENEIKEKIGFDYTQLMDLSLGQRHMLQISFDIHNLALGHGRDPDKVLNKQKMLIVLNEYTCAEIINEFINHNFYGFKQEHVFFMVQASFHGIKKDPRGHFYYNLGSEKRLYNHGHMALQQTWEDTIFYIGSKNEKMYLRSNDYQRILEDFYDKVSYNIEDLEYLRNSLDLYSLSLALDARADGYNMIMEIVANNPIKPQKGGMAAFDPLLERNVMIESFQLDGIENHEIKFLNKNINHYPNPGIVWQKLKSSGINMPLCLKKDHIFFQPVQGDMNFLVNTLFVMRQEFKPISGWKDGMTTIPTIIAMKNQDEQKGFKEYVRRFVKI